MQLVASVAGLLADPERLAGRILQMGDVVGLVERAQAHIDEGEQAELQEKVLGQGRFTLEDFLVAMRQIQKMGPLDQLISQRTIDDHLLVIVLASPPTHLDSLCHIAHHVSSPSRLHGPGSRSRTYTEGPTRPWTTRPGWPGPVAGTAPTSRRLQYDPGDAAPTC